ncbi:MAG: glycosyltransferase [Ferruginibacter sp.]
MPNTKIKLLITVPSLGCGGLERNISIICNNINTDKFDVTLTILNNADQFFEITNPAIKIIDLKIPSVRKSLFAIAKLSRKLKPDIILTAANHLNLFFGIFRWLFPKRMKIIGRESSIMSKNSPTNWNPGFYNWISRKFYKKLDLVICQSVFMQDDLVHHYQFPAKQARIINNAVQPPVVNWFNTDNATGSIPKLITVARLIELKGVERLIRSVAHLTIPFEYTIIGEGELRPGLEKLIKELSLENKVFMPGGSDQPFAKVANPDLFLMGSHFEGFPNVLLEANAIGIPVVAFNAPGGIGELIINNETGILVETENEADFAVAIVKALAYSFDRNKISTLIRNRFDVKKIIHQWEDLFEEINSQ